MHEDFLDTIRFARKFESLEEKGEDTTNLRPPKIRYDNYVQCPTCLRKFAPIPAERHISHCKDIINKPKPLIRMPTDTQMHFPQINNKAKRIGNKNQNINSLNNSTVKEDSMLTPYYFSPSLSKNEFYSKSPIPSTMGKNSTEIHDPYTMKTHRRDSSVQRSNAFTVECSHCGEFFDQKGLEKHLQAFAKELAKTKQFRMMSESPYPKYSPVNMNTKNQTTKNQVSSTFRLRRSNKTLNEIEVKCKRCEATIGNGARFCMMCGVKVS